MLNLKSCLPVAALVISAAMAYLLFSSAPSNDLFALWMAGKAVARDMPWMIYPPESAVFTMKAPDIWGEWAAEEGRSGDIYPFIYPPLWAWVMAPLTNATDFASVSKVATLINGGLLAGTILVAGRMAAQPSRRQVWFVTGFTVLLFTTPGTVALLENQPQILVAFLTVLAIERASKGHELTGGAALALAAALKLSPALLAVLWLATGQWRALIGFVIVGAALAAGSVLLAGWPLHQTFLLLAGQISDSILVTKHSFTISASLAQFFWPDDLSFVASRPGAIDGTPVSGWLVMTKGDTHSLIEALALLAALAGFGLMLKKARGSLAEPAIWAAALTALPLLGPISWTYYYIAPLAFAALLPQRLGHIGVLLLGLVALPISVIAHRLTFDWPSHNFTMQYLGTGAMVLYLVACLYAARQED